MAVTTAVTAVVGLGYSIYSSVDNSKHAATDASNNQNVAQDELNAQATQQQQKLNTQAANTAGAQARVRAIANPSGDSILTTPLGATGPAGQVGGDGNTSPGSMNASAGKAILGG